MTKQHWKYVAGALGALALLFVLGVYGLGMQKFFAPKAANIDREVWENTQSRVEGMVQQLARYKHEYDLGDDSTKAIIRQTIVSQFANFDANKVDNVGLRNFLTEQRGF